MITVTPQDRVFVLTGAGISADSGLQTFRDSDGLWKGVRFEEVATPEAWRRDPRNVWEFYSMRRKKAAEVEPNAAHYALADLEGALGDRMLICTQNVDDLHEQAGCSRVLHMHGNLFQSRCESCGRTPFVDRDAHEDEIPKCRACGGKIRPNIVWFGEVPLHLDRILRELELCTIFIAIGTSGVVHPAAGFVGQAKLKGVVRCCYYIGLEEPANRILFDEIILGHAAEVLPRLFQHAKTPTRS